MACEEQTPVQPDNARNLLGESLLRRHGKGARKAGRTSNLDAILNPREVDKEGRLAGNFLDPVLSQDNSSRCQAALEPLSAC